MADSPHDGEFRLPLHGDVERGRPFTIDVDGRPMLVYEGETVAGALFAHGIRVFRVTARGTPRGLYCGIGICYDCLLVVDGRPSTRACMTYVAPGMKVETQHAEAQPSPWPSATP